MGTVETSLREGWRTEAVLVGDHHQFEAGRHQPLQRTDHAGHEGKFLEAVDLVVRRLLDETAIAVDEENLPAHASAPTRSAARTRSFSLPVPIVMRNASPSPGYFVISRTTTPAARRRRYVPGASSNRTARKLACDGST